MKKGRGNEMKIRKNTNLFILIVIFWTNLYFCSTIGASYLQDQSAASSVPNTGWQLDNGWTINESELIGKGHSWATYENSCREGPLTLKFKLKSLKGGLHTNINVEGADRYAIGFFSNENGSLSVYLFKQVGAIPPTFAEYIQGQYLIDDTTQEHQVDIISQSERIQVYIYRLGETSEVALPVIDFIDQDPLPAGGIAFESLNDSIAKIYDVEVICPSLYSEKEELPNLGIGYGERPA